MLRDFAPQFQLSQPAKITTCLDQGLTLLLHTNTCELLSGGSYPNEWHKFLTGVLIRAGNRQMVKKLWVWPQVNFNISTLQGVHMNTQWIPEGRWRRHGRKPCPIAAEMEYGWLRWDALHNNEWVRKNERTAPYNQNVSGGLSDQLEQSYFYCSDSLGSALINWLLGMSHPFNSNYSASTTRR